MKRKRQQIASSALKRQSFPSPRHRPGQGGRRSPGRGRPPSACSETHRGAESMKRRRGGGEVLPRRSGSASHRQVVDSFGKRSDLPHGALGVLHLQTRHTHRTGSELRKSATEGRCKGAEEAAYLLRLLLVHLDPGPLEAAALGHLHVHGADKLLAVVRALLPQRAETAERQASRLSSRKRVDLVLRRKFFRSIPNMSK